MNDSNRTFVFIDERVADREILLAAFGNDSRWALIDAGDDGLRQINAILAGEHNLASLRIIAHAQPGTLHLGNNTLATIGRVLETNGDVQLYACELGQGRVGRAFVAELSTRLGVAVAAASNPVGHAELGGDWRLDVGQTRTPPLAVPQWPGRLGMTVVRLPNTFPVTALANGATAKPSPRCAPTVRWSPGARVPAAATAARWQTSSTARPT